MAQSLSPAAQTTQHRLAAGATLMMVGLITGLWAGVSLTWRTDLDFPRLALSSHLNALLGGMWMIIVALTFSFLRYGERGLRRLALTVALVNWANWSVTLLASFLDVRGLSFGLGLSNDTVAGLLQTFVVIPGLIGACAWMWGFRRNT